MGSTSEHLAAQGWQVEDPELLDGEPQDMELTSGAQLQALADGFRLRLLASIGRDPGSAKQLADRFDVPTTRLYHHLDLLEEQGFIEVVATRRSGARTERCYGTPPRRSIRPSGELVDAEDRSELAAAMRAIAEVVGATLAEGVRSGALEVPSTRDVDEAVRDVVTWSTARLTRAQRQEFGRELMDLTQRIVDASTANDESGTEDADATTLYFVLAPDTVTAD